jgi:hypothetical protein
MANKIGRYPVKAQHNIRILFQNPLVREKSEGPYLPPMENIGFVWRSLDTTVGLSALDGFLVIVKAQTGIPVQQFAGLCEGLDVIERSINLN